MQRHVSVVGFLLLALMFILPGFGKPGNIEGTAAFFASGGRPAPTVLVAGLFCAAMRAPAAYFDGNNLATGVFTSGEGRAAANLPVQEEARRDEQTGMRAKNPS